MKAPILSIAVLTSSSDSRKSQLRDQGLLLLLLLALAQNRNPKKARSIHRKPQILSPELHHKTETSNIVEPWSGILRTTSEILRP